MNWRVKRVSQVRYGWVATVEYKYFFYKIRKLLRFDTSYSIIYYTSNGKKWYETESYIHPNKKIRDELIRRVKVGEYEVGKATQFFNRG